jgi:hypothetical protein
VPVLLHGIRHTEENTDHNRKVRDGNVAGDRRVEKIPAQRMAYRKNYDKGDSKHPIIAANQGYGPVDAVKQVFIRTGSGVFPPLPAGAVWIRVW